MNARQRRNLFREIKRNRRDMIRAKSIAETTRFSRPVQLRVIKTDRKNVLATSAKFLRLDIESLNNRREIYEKERHRLLRNSLVLAFFAVLFLAAWIMRWRDGNSAYLLIIGASIFSLFAGVYFKQYYSARLTTKRISQELDEIGERYEEVRAELADVYSHPLKVMT